MSFQVKHYYPGGNTTEGFFSYYHYIADLSEINDVYCLKGGPGVGKSTFMKTLGLKAEKCGYNVNYYYCSSDNESIDGVLIKEKKVLVVDGTAPHIVDPKYPGAAESILNFADYYDNSILKPKKKEIMNISSVISNNYVHAYQYLKAAKILFNNVRKAYALVEDKGCKSDIARRIIDEAFRDKKGGGYGERKLFLSALTPAGPDNYLNETIDNKNVYILDSQCGDFACDILESIRRACEERGFFVELFYCPVDPASKIDHLIIPQLDTAVVTSNCYHLFKQDGTHVDLVSCYDASHINKDMISFDMGIFDDLVNRAIRHFRICKAEHDLLESYYKTAMDFKKLSQFSDKIIEKIIR